MILFNLIKSLSKAEKRNFKIYCSNSDSSKYIQLYNALDTLNVYDEKKTLAMCPNISKSQLNNLKTQLYYRLLGSLAQLFTSHNYAAQIRQTIDFSAVLIDKGLVNQAIKILMKAKNDALKYELYTVALSIIDQLKNIRLMQLGRNDLYSFDTIENQANMVSDRISNINALSNLTIQLSNLSLKLGYARSEKDNKLIIVYFGNKLEVFDEAKMSFHEKLYYYQCKTCYYLIQHNFVNAYRWCHRWYQLFEGNDTFKVIYFDHYIRCNSRLLDILFMTRRLSQMKVLISKLKTEHQKLIIPNIRTTQSYGLTLLFGEINSHFLEGTFKEGLSLVDKVEKFIEQNDALLLHHYRMLLNYKVACLYFGCQDYKNCIKHLQRIISVKDPVFRRDLQVFSRILNLIASYEIGDDETLDKQVRSVYSFVLKTNDMHEVQSAIIQFLKRLPYIYATNFKDELIVLYNKLKPLENYPYKRRPFFYLDIISWLESKIYNIPMAKIRQDKIDLK